MLVRTALPLLGGVGALFATDFKTTISLGSVIVAMLVVVLFGVFSFRDRRNSGWKDLYEQKNERVESLLEEKEAERVVRHGVKDELAATKAKLAIEMNKPDLAVILEQQRALWTESTNSLTGLLKAMQETQLEMLSMLQEGGTR